jgi:hypothetical protein
MSMAIRPEDLPSDPARLIEMVLSLDAENDRLRAVIDTFKDMVFGSRSERATAKECASRSVERRRCREPGKNRTISQSGDIAPPR